jgi:hypothetical protein
MEIVSGEAEKIIVWHILFPHRRVNAMMRLAVPIFLGFHVPKASDHDSSLQ